MVEPLVVAIRNSLFPVRSVLQGKSPATVLAGGSMHYQQQTSFFSSNLLGPSPRQTKGKEREREEPRLRRVLQCREWSCCNARNFLYCPEHGIPFMLQELLPPRERPIRRFQSPKAHIANRFSKYTSPRTRSLPNGQRRHASHAVRPTRAPSRSRGQPEASSSTRPESASTPARTLPPLSHLSKFIEGKTLADFDLEEAWKAFNIVLQTEIADGGVIPARRGEELLVFIQRFCDKIELFYQEDDSFHKLKLHRERLRTMIDWLRKNYRANSEYRVVFVQHLNARTLAMFGQFESATEILESLRAMQREPQTLILKTYTSIISSIFYFRDSLHVVDFLTQHFFFEYFHPPYCHHYRDEGATALTLLHPRLLYILASLQDPVSLFRAKVDKPLPDRYRVYQLLILAYCHYKLPQLALRVYESFPASPKRKKDMDGQLKLRIVRALVRGGYFDDAYRLYSTVPEDTPEHRNTGIHLFALQGDHNAIEKQFRAKSRSKHRRAMLLSSLAVRGRTWELRNLFEELYPRGDNGEYTHAVPSAMDYAIAIYAHARRSNPEGIQFWVDRMAKDGIKPNLYAYSSIIQSYLQTGDLSAVAGVLDQMRGAGLAPNVVVYTNIITALTRNHKPSTAEGIFKRALSEEVIPDQAMVGALMNCYVEAGQWNDVVRLFKSLEENKRSPLRLTIEMYNIALKGYVLMGAPFRVIATLFERLDADENVAPTPITFALLLQSACDSGNMGAAMDIFQEMDRRAKQHSESLMNPFTFTILMAGFLRKGDKDKAMEIYRDMSERGIQPTSITFNTVLSYYSNEKAHESLQVAYEFMTRIAKRREDAPIIAEDNLTLSPIHLVYEPLLRGYSSKGNVEGFEKLLQEMLDAGGKVTVTVLTYLLNLYRQKDRLDSATKVWSHLLDLGTETMNAAKFPREGKDSIESRTDILCVPLTIYLDMLSSAGEHEEVLETWQDYQRRGFSFNFFNWNRLGEYLVCAGEYERAFEVLDRIILPYIRIMRNETRESSNASQDSTVDPEAGKSEEEEVWRSPFDVLNKTSLSFLQSIIIPARPLSSLIRSKVVGRRSLRNLDDDIVSALSHRRPPNSPSTVPPTQPSDVSSPSPSSSEQAPVTPLHPTSEPQTSQPLDFNSIPDFVRPLWALGHKPEGNAPQIHYSLSHHLLIGIQRLRAGQPPVASSSPAQASHQDLYHVDYSREQQERVREMLGRIHVKYPDAVASVLEFEEKEKMRLGDSYNKLYTWA